MIKPLQSVSNVAFKSGLEDYQQQIRDKKEPRYNLVLSPGADAPRPTVKSGIAGIFKGYNNITGMIAGTAKGLACGAVLGGLTGAVVKNFKENSKTIIDETGRRTRNVQFWKFLSDTSGDIVKCAGSAVKRIGEVTQMPLKTVPGTLLKDLASLPGKYMKYLGKGNKLAKVLAIGVGAGTLVYNILKAKVHANRKNADVDHSLNLKH